MSVAATYATNRYHRVQMNTVSLNNAHTKALVGASLKGYSLHCIIFRTATDPCMGSGHILVYAFDVLMDIYTACGWSERDAAVSILRNNLYGLDIDRRAYQLAYFAVMMKARQYNRRILRGENQPNLANFADVMGVNTSMLSGSLRQFVEQFQFADTYGSLMTVTAPAGLDEMVAAFHPTIGLDEVQLKAMVKLYKILSQKYDVVCTNPPYMGSSGMNAVLSDYVKKNFPDSKSDLFACFMEKCGQLVKRNGLYAMITQHAWMFLSSYEKLREKLKMNSIVNMAHLGARAFDEIGGEVVQTTAFVSCGKRVADFKGTYVRLVDIVGEWEKEAEYRSGNHRYTAKQENFSKIPGSPVAYWVSEKIIEDFEKYPRLNDVGITRLGMTTGENARFVRLWYEVDINNCKFNADSQKDLDATSAYYVPYNKGGAYRKWYGNNDCVLYWKNNGAAIKNFADKNGRIRSTVPNTEYYFLPCASWSKISSGKISFRLKKHSIFDVAGACYFAKKYDLSYMMGFLNSDVVRIIISALSPTLNYEGGQIASLPVAYDKKEKRNIILLVDKNIELSKNDWDSFETSWDFERHPLI